MQPMTVFAFLLALWSPAALQATDVRVTPLFWTGQEKPGFKIQCRNDSQSARHRLDYIVKGAALRLLDSHAWLLRHHDRT